MEGGFGRARLSFLARWNLLRSETGNSGFCGLVLASAELLPVALLQKLRPVRIYKPCHIKGGFVATFASFRKCIVYPSAVKQTSEGRVLR
jgi:hypothetical protein